MFKLDKEELEEVTRDMRVMHLNRAKFELECSVTQDDWEKEDLQELTDLIERIKALADKQNI